MSKLFEELFESLVQKSRYEKADQLKTDEICRALEPYKETMSQSEYEQFRDILFYISHLAMKQSFEIGFKSAVAFMIDCMRMD